MSSPTVEKHLATKDNYKERRVQTKENVMWTGVRTSAGGSTVNRITTPGDDYSMGSRQQARSKPITAAST